MGIENLVIDTDINSEPVDRSIIIETSRLFGVRFPPSYIEFVSKHNAAALKNNYFQFFDRANNEFVKFGGGGDFYGFGFDNLNYKSIEAAQDLDIYGYDNVIVFADTAGGDHICFDYRHNPETDEPHIIYMDHEVFDEKTNKMVISHIADSFDEFCDLLSESDD